MARKKFITFINDVTHKNVQVENLDNAINNQLTKIFIDGESRNLYIWGDYLYDIKEINKPIYVFDNIYQIVTLEQVGYYYVEESNDEYTERFEELGKSKSFKSYTECYDAMKIAALNALASDFDIETNFDFNENEVFKTEVKFTKNMISVQIGGHINRYTIKYK